jgi:hypothetical protein
MSFYLWCDLKWHSHHEHEFLHVSLGRGRHYPCIFLGRAWLPGRCQWRPSTTGCSGSHPSTMTGVLTNHGCKGTVARARLRPRRRGCDREGEAAKARQPCILYSIEVRNSQGVGLEYLEQKFTYIWKYRPRCINIAYPLSCNRLGGNAYICWCLKPWFFGM